MHPQARERIRTARLAGGLSLRELGRRTGVTASLLSQIENGKSNPSVNTLAALISELGLSLDGLLRPEDVTRGGGGGAARATATGSPFAPASAEAPASAASSSPVIRPAERRSLDLVSGVVRERLTRDPGGRLEAFLVTYQPGATSSPDGRPVRHEGIEHAYLIRGELTLHCGAQTHRLTAGDALQFDADVPHVYGNSGAIPAQGLWFVSRRDTGPAGSAPLGLPDLGATSATAALPSFAELLRAFGQD